MPRQALAEAIHFNQCNVSVPGRGDHRDGAALGLRMGLEPKTDALRMQPHHAVGGLEMDQGAGVGGVALGTDPAPIPRHIRYSRYSRYRADFIGTFCPLSIRYSRPVIRYIRYSRPLKIRVFSVCSACSGCSASIRDGGR
jgi:hypothetical protein